MNKNCKTCGISYPIESFPLKYDKKRPDARRSYCKECEYKRIRKRSDTKKYLLKNKSIEYLGSKCNNENCPIKYLNLGSWVFDFHHLGDKENGISELLQIRGMTWDKIKPELDKCVLLCVLCHRLEHLKSIDRFSTLETRHIDIISADKVLPAKYQ